MTLFEPERACPICTAPLAPPRLRCCCDRCGCSLYHHSAGLHCRKCNTECGIDCSPGVRRRMFDLVDDPKLRAEMLAGLHGRRALAVTDTAPL